ncbi:hypothetical protein [Orrella marina]|uniref:hypothetical protein n=1 Tax=Orrella marina TaxID=2163011 RepID=UPI00131F2749|nr:hypothetical protein [Orrella marina]
MSHSLVSRVVLCGSLVLIAGCSSIVPSFLRGGSSDTNPCKVNPQSCIYRGQYEPGEREYAEREARRLNYQSMERLNQQVRAAGI